MLDLLGGGVACCLSTALLAHHGGAAFDQGQTVTFNGTVTEMTFTNPHILIYWDVRRMARPRSGPAG